MRLLHSLAKTHAMFDDPNLVSHAGLVPVMALTHRAGLPGVAAHRLRHSVATAMLREGASLSEIAAVLRHRNLATTAIYAKVDHATLRGVARPWPAGAR